MAGALLCPGAIHRPAPALSSSLRRCSPHSVPAHFLRYACVLPRTVLALSVALHWCSPPHYASVQPFTVMEHYIGLRGRSMQAPALFISLRSSPPSFAGALPYTMPALGRAKTARARSRLILFAAGLLVGEPRGGAGYGARCRNRSIVWYSRRRHVKFPALHRASDTGRIGPKIGF